MASCRHGLAANGHAITAQRCVIGPHPVKSLDREWSPVWLHERSCWLIGRSYRMSLKISRYEEACELRKRATEQLSRLLYVAQALSAYQRRCGFKVAGQSARVAVLKLKRKEKRREKKLLRVSNEPGVQPGVSQDCPSLLTSGPGSSSH